VRKGVVMQDKWENPTVSPDKQKGGRQKRGRMVKYRGWSWASWPQCL
jgi:hypothetical protein